MEKRPNDINHEIRASIIETLRTDLEVTLEFLAIARASHNPETVIRNRRNARKAYDAVLRSMARLKLTPYEAERIEGKLQQLRSEFRFLANPRRWRSPPRENAGLDGYPSLHAFTRLIPSAVAAIV